MCKSIDATAEYRLLLNKDITRGERDYLVYPLEMMQFFCLFATPQVGYEHGFGPF